MSTIGLKGEIAVPEENDKPNRIDRILDQLQDPMDYAAAFLGAGIGGLIDLSTIGATAGQGAVAGSCFGLGLKRGVDGLLQKSRQKKQCREYIEYYKNEGDEEMLASHQQLLRKIKTVKTLSATEIKKEIALIEARKKP
tara:strand:+ start:2578 stop:2994 length:417 start_codon:yes stop_codon:yes gene_type:complete